jgi:flagellar basal body rod protein FlgB
MNPNGNNVSIEEEMQKVSMNASDYQLVLGLEKATDKLYNIALGKPQSS